MVSIFEQLGVRTIINAAGPVTRLSGARMDADVIDAMREAAQVCVDIAELQAGAGQLIAEVTGAEAGYVTSGAAAGLVLATAACVTGMDPGKMNRLPDTSGMKNEVIMPRSHRNFYDHAVRSVGVTLIEVGIPDRFSGAGVRDTEALGNCRCDDRSDRGDCLCGAVFRAAATARGDGCGAQIRRARYCRCCRTVAASGKFEAVYQRGCRCGLF